MFCLFALLNMIPAPLMLPIRSMKVSTKISHLTTILLIMLVIINAKRMSNHSILPVMLLLVSITMVDAMTTIVCTMAVGTIGRRRVSVHKSI